MSLPTTWDDVPVTNFHTATTFVEGFDHARLGTVLIGFPEWLRSQDSRDLSGYTWDVLVGKRLFPAHDDSFLLEVTLGRGPNDAVAVAGLRRLLQDFEADKAAVGLSGIFERYRSWAEMRYRLLAYWSFREASADVEGRGPPRRFTVMADGSRKYPVPDDPPSNWGSCAGLPRLLKTAAGPTARDYWATVAYTLGFDAGSCGAALSGFQEWCSLDGGMRHADLLWFEQIIRRAVPGDASITAGESDLGAVAVAALIEATGRFSKLRWGLRDGLPIILLAHSAAKASR